MPDLGNPASYLTCAKGVPVYASGGEQVGTVEHVLSAPEEDIFDGVVLDTPHGHRFVDAPEVAEIYERGVELTIGAHEVAALPEPSANAAAMEADPEDVEGSALGHKLRRAWDLLSGNY
jgi:hypothetical protein